MSTQKVNSFLRLLKTRIDAVAGVGRCLVLPAVTLDKLRNDPAWPTVLITDNGGEIHPVNGVLWQMTADITVINHVTADAYGEEDLLAMQELGDAVMAALNYVENETLYIAAESSVDTEQDEEGMLYVLKSYRIEYLLDTRQNYFTPEE